MEMKYMKHSRDGAMSKRSKGGSLTSKKCGAREGAILWMMLSDS